jgi:hypothetical protein
VERCVICDIVRGDVAAERIDETDGALVFI